MQTFAFRFFSKEQAEKVFGIFEIVKLPKTKAISAQKILKDGMIARELIRGDRLFLFKGLNKLMFKTWDNFETLISIQKEFITLDGFRGTFYLSDYHSDNEACLTPVINSNRIEQINFKHTPDFPGLEKAVNIFNDRK